MELQSVLEKRRSIRKYKPIPVEREKIREIIKAATLAPSWKNSQVTRYYVACGEKTLLKVKETFSEYNRKNTADAPVLIAVTIVKGISGFAPNGEKTNELGDGWGCYDCGLQNMNLLLKAAELGLSTLVMGLRDAEKLRSIFSIPETEEVISVIALGYGDIQPQMPPRKPVDEIAKFFEE